MEKDSIALCQVLDACFLPMVIRGDILTPNSSQLLVYQSAECWHFFPSIPLSVDCVILTRHLHGRLRWMMVDDAITKIAFEEVIHNQICHWRKRSSDIFCKPVTYVKLRE